MKRHRKFSADERSSYLSKLLNELKTTSSLEAKEQVLANLCNFAYDPVNYKTFRKLNIIPVLFEQLESDQQSKSGEFAIKGLCNLAADPENEALIVSHNGMSLLKRCLSSASVEIVVSALSMLVLFDAKIPEDIKICINELTSSSEKRISNIARILQDIYSQDG